MSRLFLAVLLTLFASGQANARTLPPSTTALHYSYAPLVEKAAPAVVNIYARSVVREAPALFADPMFRQFFGGQVPYRQRVQRSLGSGVLVSAGGTVMTNSHVIGDSEDITVVLADRREFKASVQHIDKQTDLAVLTIDNAAGQSFPFVPMGDSEALRVGDIVLAIGNPFGIGQTVTSGIVSGLARTAVGITDYSFFIQTDAAINPGNSGGALVDMSGRLIGIPTAIFSRSGASNGIGFAIPATMARTVLAASRNGGVVARGWLGLDVQPVTADLANALGLPRPAGVLVKAIHARSPARGTGVREGDVVTSLGGKAVDDPESLRFRLATTPLGEQLALEFWRDGKRYNGNVTLTTPPETPARHRTTLQGEHPLHGVSVVNINPAVADELDLMSSSSGVVVMDVDARSIARRFGLQPGDIIAVVNGEAIRSVKQLSGLLAKPQPAWQLQLVRAGQTLTVQIR